MQARLLMVEDDPRIRAVLDTLRSLPRRPWRGAPRVRRRRKLSLRHRVALTFGLLMLLVTGALAVVTWNLATGYMQAQRESSVLAQAEVNVRLVDGALQSGEGLSTLLRGLATDSESSVLLRGPQGWLSSGRLVMPADLPAALVARAEVGTAGPERVVVRGAPVLAVAMPTADGGVFVQLFPLAELERTFRFLGAVLVAGVVVGVGLGVALGWWTSRRALRPLGELTRAASRMAAGDLTARLPAQDDPDLAPLAHTFNRTADALEARVRRDERFAGDVSHELRSPLTTMANAAAVLQRRRAEMSETAGKALDLLTTEVERFRHTVVDLLEISRDEQVEREPIDLGELVALVLEHRDGDPVPTQLERPGPFVLGDRRRLERVVANLLDNADTYAGGAVRVAVLGCGGTARIEVDDAGPGVPPPLREVIFERFARGDRTAHHADGGGTGLGLALVAQHTRRFGGSVRVEDRPGGGARFVVELPADRHFLRT